jgi:soluble lytic murein transglycosylase-like protein
MRAALLTLLLLVLALPANARAGLFTYVDEHGVRHYTNVPADSRARPVRLKKIITTNLPDRPRAVIRYSRPTTVRPRQKAVVVNHAAIERHILRAASENRVDPLLIKAIIKTESNFDQFAVSSKGAQGLMQLMPETARDLQVDNPFDAYENIAGGARYLRTLLDTFAGDLKLSLAAYNAGPGCVTRHGGIPNFPETTAYVRKVLRHYHNYRKQHALATSINLRHMVTVN